MHKGFGSNIVNSYPAEVACRNVADLRPELGYLLGSNIFLLFKSLELALQELVLRLRLENVLLVALIPIVGELNVRSLHH